MEHVRIETTQNVDIAFEVAGIGDRVLAALIDYLVLFAYGLFVLMVAGVAGMTSVLIGFALPYLLYFPASEILFDGQSLGKYVRHIKVVRLDGRQPTLAHYLLRWLFRFIEIDLTTGLLALLTLLIHGKGQRLGDLAAGTTVVRIQPRVRLHDTLLADIPANHVPTFPDLAALSDEDITIAKEVLRAMHVAGRTRQAEGLGRRTKAALERKLGSPSPLLPREFLRALIEDYNHEKGRLE